MKTLRKIIPLIQENLETILTLRNDKVKKEDESFVSKGDLLMDDLIMNFVKSNYSNYFLISEETFIGSIENLDSYDYVVVVDPIDGTENFVSGLREWGVGISVYKKGIHFESLMALPELNEYVLTGDRLEKYQSRIAGLSSSLTKQNLIELKEAYEYRIIGCCMYNMLQVVKGSFATFENPKGANSWDILPGLNLALEHNLKVTVNNQPYYGELLSPDQKYIFRVEQN